MNHQERHDFLNDFIHTKCFPLLMSKGLEYSRGEVDANSNFKRLALELDSKATTICYVYLKKHLDAISYYIRTGETKSDEPIESRIADAINYLLLMASLISEINEPPRKT